MSQEQDLDNWSVATESINLAALDEMVAKLTEARKEYDAKKRAAAESYEAVEKLEAQISSALQSAGKSKYFVDGYGTAYLINKYVVRTPKDNDSKKALFNYIKDKYGEDVLVSKLSINHQTLNAFYNEETSALAKELKIQTIPGIEEPVHEINLGFRKE